MSSLFQKGKVLTIEILDQEKEEDFLVIKLFAVYPGVVIFRDKFYPMDMKFLYIHFQLAQNEHDLGQNGNGGSWTLMYTKLRTILGYFCPPKKAELISCLFQIFFLRSVLLISQIELWTLILFQQSSQENWTELYYQISKFWDYKMNWKYSLQKLKNESVEDYTLKEFIEIHREMSHSQASRPG